MRRGVARSLILLSGCVFLPKVWGGLPGEDLFQQALFKESGERNPQAAIALYRRIVDVPDADRMILFAARLRMVRCYERVGKFNEALKEYEQILKETAAPQSDLSREVQAELLRLKTRKQLSNQETRATYPDWGRSFGLGLLQSLFSQTAYRVIVGALV